MLLNAPRMCCVGDNSGSGLAFRHSNMSSGSGVRTATSKTELVVVVVVRGDLGGLDLTKGDSPDVVEGHRPGMIHKQNLFYYFILFGK